MNLLDKNNSFMWRNVVSEVDPALFATMLQGFDPNYLTYLLGLRNNEILEKIANGEIDIDPRTYSLLQMITNNHPIFEIRAFNGFDKPLSIQPPSLDDFRKYRQESGLTQLQFSKLMRLNRNTVKDYDKGLKKPPASTWTLFLLATNQHPNYEIVFK